ncbi:MAG: hypothetical protein AAF806_10790 [Bacteroidota bacterium]
MANGKDIDWQPIAYCAGALIIGLVVGTLLVAPSMKKTTGEKSKNQRDQESLTKNKKDNI